MSTEKNTPSASPEPMACEILSGPRTHICWTPDGTPPEQREQVVLIRYADFKRLTGSSQAKSTAPAQWEDHRVQKVYEILCRDDAPPPGEHWEGFQARLIVDAICGATPAALTDAARRLMLAADDVNLGRSIHNERKSDDKIEGPVWDELKAASSAVRTLLAQRDKETKNADL